MKFKALKGRGSCEYEMRFDLNVSQKREKKNFIFLFIEFFLGVQETKFIFNVQKCCRYILYAIRNQYSNP